MTNWNEDIPLLETKASRCYYDIARTRAEAIELMMKSKHMEDRSSAIARIESLREKVNIMETVDYPELEQLLSEAQERKVWGEQLLHTHRYFLKELRAFTEKHIRKRDCSHTKEDLSPEGILCELVKRMEDRGFTPKLLLKGDVHGNEFTGCAYNDSSMPFRLVYQRKDNIGYIEYLV